MAADGTPKAGRWCSRNVLALGLVSFLTDIHSETILALLPQFMADTLGLSKGTIGLVEGLAEATASLLKIVSGWFSDRIGRRKPLVLCGYVISTITKPFLSLAGVWWHVLWVRIADRVGKGVRTSARDALLAESVCLEDRGRAYGFHRAMDTAGAVVGTTLAIVLLRALSGNYRQVFLVATIAGLAAVVTIIAGVREAPVATGTGRQSGTKPETPGSLLGFLVAHTIYSAGNFSYAFYLLRAQDVGVAPALVPALYLWHNIVYAATSYPAGALLDRFGVRRMQVVSYLAQAVACGCFALSAGAAWMPLWFAVYGAQMGATGSCSRATASGLIQAARRGVGMGVFNACEGLGLLAASVVGGALWDRLGSGAAPFYYGAATAVVAAAVAALALRPRGEVSQEGGAQ